MLAIKRQRDIKLGEEPGVCFGSCRLITQQDKKLYWSGWLALRSICLRRRNWELQIDNIPVVSRKSEMDASVVVVSVVSPHPPATVHDVTVCATTGRRYTILSVWIFTLRTDQACAAFTQCWQWWRPYWVANSNLSGFLWVFGLKFRASELQWKAPIQLNPC